MEQKNDSLIRKPKLLNIALWGIILTLLIFILWEFKVIIKPLFVAFFLWYLIKELKNQLLKIKVNGTTIPRSIRGVLAFIIILGVIVLIVEIISINVRQISTHFKDYDQQIDKLTSDLVSNVYYNTIMEEFEKFINEIEFGRLASKTANSLSSLLGSMAIVLIYLVFMLLEELVMHLKINTLFPTKNDQYQRINGIMNRINSSVRSYLVSKTIVSLILGIVCYIIMLAYGLKFALLWAFLIFILNYIPYVGSLIATLLPSLFAVLQFADGWYFLYMFASIELVQIIMANVVEPKLMGKSLNLSPITVLLSLAFWGGMWGMVGMILAVPISAIIMIILSQFESTKFLAVLFSEKGNVG